MDIELLIAFLEKKQLTRIKWGCKFGCFYVKDMHVDDLS